MDYEKKYKEAVNKIKNLLDDGEKNGFTIVTYKTDLESIFPELKESEDERIRKELITHCKNTRCVTEEGAEQIATWIAWLEKQGEQKSLPPIDDNYALKASEEYRKDRESCGIKDPIMLDEIETAFFAGATLKQNPAWSEEDESMFSQISDILWEGYKNSTGEKMSTWDNIREWCLSIKDRVQPKPKQEWSEEDKNFIKELCNLLASIAKNNYVGCYYAPDLVSKLQSLRPQPKQEWSEEDERIIHNIDAAIRHEVVFPIDELKSMKIWLESLKYRIRPKHEWKRDKKMFQLIEDVIDVYRKTQGSVIGGVHTEELKDYLKSLRPQNNWKPSDEQMTTLEYYMHALVCNEHKEILFGLYADLKKLKENKL